MFFVKRCSRMVHVMLLYLQSTAAVETPGHHVLLQCSQMVSVAPALLVPGLSHTAPQLCHSMTEPHGVSKMSGSGLSSFLSVGR